MGTLSSSNRRKVSDGRISADSRKQTYTSDSAVLLRIGQDTLPEWWNGALHLKTEECMELYLLQHGAAKSEAEDPQRSLTAIEHSDKERARQTAEIMAARLRREMGARQVAGISPNDASPSH